MPMAVNGPPCTERVQAARMPKIDKNPSFISLASWLSRSLAVVPVWGIGSFGHCGVVGALCCEYFCGMHTRAPAILVRIVCHLEQYYQRVVFAVVKFIAYTVAVISQKKANAWSQKARGD